MTNLSQSDFDNELLPPVISQSGHSITVIREAYIELSKNLIEVMDRIEDILMLENYDENDRKYIQRRDCSFTEFKLIEKDVQIHGNYLLTNILEATLDSALERSVVFFDSPNNNDWNKESQNLKIRLLKINVDTTYLLEVVNTLYISLNNIYNAFEPDYIKMLKLRYEYNEIEANFAIKFDFSVIHNQLNTEPNLIKRKNGYHQAISDRDIFCINLGLIPNHSIQNVDFKNKCLQAIQILENQIKNTVDDSDYFNSENNTQTTEFQNRMIDSDNQVKHPDFSTKRQVLAMYYLLNELDKNTNSIDRTVKARFIHFLTGKNESNIYKTLADPLKGLENKTNKKSIFKDLEFIKEHFDNLGLHSISQKITNDMQEA